MPHSRYAPSEYPFSVLSTPCHLHVNYVLIKHRARGVEGGRAGEGTECEANKRKAQSNIGKPIKGRSNCLPTCCLLCLPLPSPLSPPSLSLFLSALLVCFAFVTFRIYTLIHVKRQDDNLRCAMCFPCTQSAPSLFFLPLSLSASLLLIILCIFQIHEVLVSIRMREEEPQHTSRAAGRHRWQSP